jgi:hypothetical protein
MTALIFIIAGVIIVRVTEEGNDGRKQMREMRVKGKVRPSTEIIYRAVLALAYQFLPGVEKILHLSPGRGESESGRAI